MKTKLLLVAGILLPSILFAQPDSIQSHLHRSPFQFTWLIPPLSTNGLDFYRTINDVSFNTFVGVSAGTEVFEAAGFTNINRFYTNGVQLAGYMNVAGFSSGSQDFFSSGVQLSGFANLNGNHYQGFQGSGFANVNNSFSGVQATGFVNINKQTDQAVLLSGFSNLGYRIDHSVLLAGFANLAPETNETVELAGFANLSVKGEHTTQLAGFMNVANDIEGIQAAGFMNLARTVRGVQVSGFINVCDSIDGIPIGIISFVRKNGFRNIELSASEWSPVQLTFRMGVKKFYNIFSISKLNESPNRFALGYGFGHAVRLGQKSDLLIEALSHQEYWLFDYNFPYWVTADRFNHLLQLKTTWKYDLSRHFDINIGPTFNFSTARQFAGTTIQPRGKDIQPLFDMSLWESGTNQRWASRFWIGLNLGIGLY